jgi:hypothetical protein
LRALAFLITDYYSAEIIKRKYLNFVEIFDILKEKPPSPQNMPQRSNAPFKRSDIALPQ